MELITLLTVLVTYFNSIVELYHSKNWQIINKMVGMHSPSHLSRFIDSLNKKLKGYLSDYRFEFKAHDLTRNYVY